MIDVRSIENIPWRGMSHVCSAFIVPVVVSVDKPGFTSMSDETLSRGPVHMTLAGGGTLNTNTTTTTVDKPLAL